MNRLTFGLVVGMAIIAMPQMVQASIEGRSILQPTGFALYFPTVPGGSIPGTQYDVSDFASISASFNSQTIASLANSIPVTDAHVSFIGPDADQAYRSPGSPGTAGSGGVNPNDFTNRPTGTVFSRADVDGDGQIITGTIPGFPPPTSTTASVSSIAEVQLDSLSTNAGSSNGTVTSTAGFTFSIGTTSEIIADFDASGSLFATLDQPPGFNAAAGYSFTISIASAGVPVFVWTPDGAVNTIFGGTEILDAWDMTDNISQSFNGTNSISNPSGDFRAKVTLGPGTYSFIISQGSTASALAVSPIPEPASLVAWAIFSAFGVALPFGRRRVRE